MTFLARSLARKTFPLSKQYVYHIDSRARLLSRIGNRKGRCSHHIDFEHNPSWRETLFLSHRKWPTLVLVSSGVLPNRSMTQYQHNNCASSTSSAQESRLRWPKIHGRVDLSHPPLNSKITLNLPRNYRSPVFL